MAAHSLIPAEGTPAEIFVDYIDRMAFDNWAEHEELSSNRPAIAEFPYPRAKAARQLQAALRQKLALRAAALVSAKPMAA